MKEETVAEDQHKHDVRQAAHEAGIEGASKLSTKDAEEALGKVKSGESPEAAKQESRD